MGELADDAITSGLRAHFERFAASLTGGVERLGFKVAFNVPAVQQQLGLPYSLIAGLTTRTLHDTHVPLSLTGYSRPHVEAEVAVWLEREIAPEASIEQASDAIAYWAPAIEVVDLDRGFDQLREILTEGVFHRAVILGTPHPVQPGGDLSGVTVRVSLGERRLCEVDARAATGHAPEVLRHLARLLAPLGQRLLPGDVVILGSMNPPARPEPGQSMNVELSGIGHVALDFVA